MNLLLAACSQEPILVVQGGGEGNKRAKRRVSSPSSTDLLPSLRGPAGAATVEVEDTGKVAPPYPSAAADEDLGQVAPPYPSADAEEEAGGGAEERRAVRGGGGRSCAEEASGGAEEASGLRVRIRLSRWNSWVLWFCPPTPDKFRGKPLGPFGPNFAGGICGIAKRRCHLHPDCCIWLSN
jgi:hypothetical protein